MIGHSDKSITISTRAPTGGATGQQIVSVGALDVISTRAPTGGATRAWRCDTPGTGYFYSRPHGRGDPHAQSAAVVRQDFYSRPHGRGDFAGCASR